MTCGIPRPPVPWERCGPSSRRCAACWNPTGLLGPRPGCWSPPLPGTRCGWTPTRWTRDGSRRPSPTPVNCSPPVGPLRPSRCSTRRSGGGAVRRTRGSRSTRGRGRRSTASTSHGWWRWSAGPPPCSPGAGGRRRCPTWRRRWSGTRGGRRGGGSWRWPCTGAGGRATPCPPCAARAGCWPRSWEWIRGRSCAGWRRTCWRRPSTCCRRSGRGSVTPAVPTRAAPPRQDGRARWHRRRDPSSPSVPIGPGGGRVPRRRTGAGGRPPPPQARRRPTRRWAAPAVVTCPVRTRPPPGRAGG
ncbi:hypothetical protein G443_002439 [Actinoalloteichus cyanogriseus DSM 43889]|uniref:Uncharacterized protein n=1 Tax=Actinoalloteichus caeruleus DSM 43889 TaxID=1120930 RepID=A0ABT1JI30_ACTCY|nr:hypothetical protein [Actinoalloteichus caeruleus DSM 43889]